MVGAQWELGRPAGHRVSVVQDCLQVEMRGARGLEGMSPRCFPRAPSYSCRAHRRASHHGQLRTTDASSPAVGWTPAQGSAPAAAADKCWESRCRMSYLLARRTS